MAYNPTDHTVTAKALGVSGNAPTDGRTMYYDAVNFKYRAFVSTAEALSYLTTAAMRQPNNLIVVNTGGSLSAGVITGGTNALWHFKNGTTNGDLVAYSDAANLTGTIDGDRLAAPTTTKKGAVPALGSATGLEFLNGTGVFSDPFATDYTELTGTTWDGSKSYVTLTANTALTLTTDKKDGILYVKQDGTGSRTLSINGDSVTINTTANSWTAIAFSLVGSDYIITRDLTAAALSGAVDSTVPTLLTATVENATPSRVDMVFSEAMNATWSASSAFTVTGHTVSSITRLTSTTGYLTVTPDFVASETRTLAYTQPGSNKMQDLAGNLLANIASKSITDNVSGGDVTAPTLLTATVENATPTRVDLVFSESMNSTWSAFSTFTVSGHTVSAITRLTATTGYLTVDAFTAGETATLGYTQPGSNKMQDLAGNLLANISSMAITDNVAGSFPVSENFEAVTVGTIPSGWNANGSLVTATGAIDGSRELNAGTTPVSQQFIYGTASPLHTTTSAKFKASGGTAEMGIIQRADSATAGSINNCFVGEINTSGTQVNLYKQVGGTFTILQQKTSNLSFAAGTVYKLTYELDSSHLHQITLQRMSDNLYYDPASGWQASPIACISVTDTTHTSAGYTGLLGADLGSATIYFDTVSIA